MAKMGAVLLPSPHHHLLSLYTTCTFSNITQVTSAMSEKPTTSVLQNLRSLIGAPLKAQPTQVCSKTGKRYVLWSDIEQAFGIACYLETIYGGRVLFMINDNGEL